MQISIAQRGAAMDERVPACITSAMPRSAATRSCAATMPVEWALGLATVAGLTLVACAGLCGGACLYGPVLYVTRKFSDRIANAHLPYHGAGQGGSPWRRGLAVTSQNAEIKAAATIKNAAKRSAMVRVRPMSSP